MAAILCWATLWPLVHRALVERYDINPWKLGGFAMYTTPTPPVLVVALEGRQGALKPVDETALPDTARRALRDFRADRHALGELQTAEGVGRALLNARPDLDWVVVAVQRMKLDRQTARMTSTRQQYVFERSN